MLNFKIVMKRLILLKTRKYFIIQMIAKYNKIIPTGEVYLNHVHLPFLRVFSLETGAGLNAASSLMRSVNPCSLPEQK